MFLHEYIILKFSIFFFLNFSYARSLFKEKHRFSEQYFTRERCLSFSNLILYLLNFRKHSNQVELDQFFQVINQQNKAQQFITKSAFFQARKKCKYTAFIDLNHQLIKEIYPTNQQGLKRWRGHRLCAIDGSSIRLPYKPDIINEFGVQKGRKEQGECAMGMASVYYDVLNHLVIDASINPRKTSEKACAEKHLHFSQDLDLNLYDRGYNAFWLYAFHHHHQSTFCMRAKTKQSLQVQAFVKSGKKEQIMTISPNKTSVKTCQDKGLPSTSIQCRLIRVELKNEVEVLITNLLDKVQYPVSCFKGLYHLRWGIEENYKRLKQWLEIENFSGQSALSIRQDFYAKIVALNLTTLVVISSQNVVSKRKQKCRLKYQVNFAQALSKMKHKILYLLSITVNKKMFYNELNKLIEYISKTIEAVRRGRSFPRKLKNIKNDIHYSQYKSSL